VADRGSRPAGQARLERYERGRSLAQWFCLIVGPTLILVGLLGFLAEAKFDTAQGGDPGQLDGEDFIIFEVNGWHNVFHIISGLFLLLFAGRHAAAKSAVLAFAAVYALVSIIGLLDGKDILDVIPIDEADNVLHIVLAAAALVAGLVSTRERGRVAASPLGDRGAPGARRMGTVPERIG
jgi:hypothetical protein